MPLIRSEVDLTRADRESIHVSKLPDVSLTPTAERHLAGRIANGKKLLMGADPAQVLNRDAMANADCIDGFVELARQRAASGGKV